MEGSSKIASTVAKVAVLRAALATYQDLLDEKKIKCTFVAPVAPRRIASKSRVCTTDIAFASHH